MNFEPKLIPKYKVYTMKKLFFALITSFLFVAIAWGQCTLDVTPNGKEYSLGESGSSIFYIPEEFIFSKRELPSRTS